MLALARSIGADAALTPGECALDVGGGFGDHAAQWVDLGVRSVVAEPAPAMWRHARARRGVAVVGARAERLPFRTDGVGLYYAHLSIHYTEPTRALDEALRVVRRGGSIAIGTLGPRHHTVSFLARWFPSIADADAGRFPIPDDLVSHLEAAGVAAAGIERVDIAKTRPAGEWRRAVLGGFVSSLQFVPAAEFAAGLAAFDRRHPDPAEPIEYVIRYDWVRAHV